MNSDLMTRIDSILKRELTKEIIVERKKIGPLHKHSDLAWVKRAVSFWKEIAKEYPKSFKVKHQLENFQRMEKELSK